jgi:hypothetical protein
MALLTERVSRRVRELSQLNGAVDGNKKKTKSYRGGSAPVSKTWSKPPVSNWRERSQYRSAMDGSEEAGPRHSEGLRIGSADGRASAPFAKPGPLAPQWLPCRCVRLSGAANRVTGAVTRKQWFSCFTGEVPPRPGSPNQVRAIYKARPKRGRYARAQRRRSPPPLLWGCQHSQSKLAQRPTERQNLSQHPERFRLMEPVSPPIPAPLRLAVASCAAIRHELRHSSQKAQARAGCSSSLWETTAWS